MKSKHEQIRVTELEYQLISFRYIRRSVRGPNLLGLDCRNKKLRTGHEAIDRSQNFQPMQIDHFHSKYFYNLQLSIKRHFRYIIGTKMCAKFVINMTESGTTIWRISDLLIIKCRKDNFIIFRLLLCFSYKSSRSL